MRLSFALVVLVVAGGGVVTAGATCASRTPDCVRVDDAKESERARIRGRIVGPKEPRGCAGWQSQRQYTLEPHGHGGPLVEACGAAAWQRIELAGDTHSFELDPALAATLAELFPDRASASPPLPSVDECPPPPGFDMAREPAEYRMRTVLLCLPDGAEVVTTACRYGSRVARCDEERSELPVPFFAPTRIDWRLAEAPTRFDRRRAGAWFALWGTALGVAALATALWPRRMPSPAPQGARGYRELAVRFRSDDPPPVRRSARQSAALAAGSVIVLAIAAILAFTHG